MFDQFEVAQDHGKTSKVTVHKRIEQGYPGDSTVFDIHTDQSLSSNSERAWNVNEAIKRYCYKHGFDIRSKTRNAVEAVYNPRTHSYSGFYKILLAVKADPRYKTALENAEAARDEINERYGEAIRELGHIVHSLRARNDEELETLNQHLCDLQREIVTELEIPDFITSLDHKRLVEPQYPPDTMKPGMYYRKTRKESITLHSILELLN